MLTDFSSRQYEHQTQYHHVTTLNHPVERTSGVINQNDADKIKVSKKLIASIKNSIQANTQLQPAGVLGAVQTQQHNR